MEAFSPRETNRYTSPKRQPRNPRSTKNFAMFSYDRALKKVVLRQFHAEGFVNEYLLESAGSDGKLLEFATVRIENIAPGWKAKEVYRIISPDEIVETFFTGSARQNL